MFVTGNNNAQPIHDSPRIYNNSEKVCYICYIVTIRCGTDFPCNILFFEMLQMLHLVFCLICSIMAANVNKAGQTHDQLQAACYQWACKAYHPFVFGRLICIPNDMHAGNTVRYKQYEAIGVTPGVWDMVFFWLHEVVWWEFKVGSDKLSKTRIVKGKKKRGQLEHAATLLPFGHKFFVASEEHEFQQQFKNIIEPTLEEVKRITDKSYGVERKDNIGQRH